MMNKRRIITVGGTLMCALGVGYFMQMGAQVPAPAAPSTQRTIEPQSPNRSVVLTQSSVTPLTAPVLPAADVAAPSVEVSAPVATAPIPAKPAPVEVPAALREPVVLAALDTDDGKVGADPLVTGPLCDIVASAEPEAGAMVRLTVAADCRPNERVAIHHNGMMFTDVTDAAGGLDIAVPALAELAVFIVEFANGDGAVATTQVTSLPFYDRVVLQWADDVSFEVHAREFGAEYGSDGHVWSGAARDMTAAALGQGGFLTALGNSDTFAPRLAQVYTFPTATAAQSGTVALTVETEITAANCDRLIEAQALELRSEGGLATRDLSLNMPGCDAIGDFLVLNNLMDDLKIAAK